MPLTSPISRMIQGGHKNMRRRKRACDLSSGQSWWKSITLEAPPCQTQPRKAKSNTCGDHARRSDSKIGRNRLKRWAIDAEAICRRAIISSIAMWRVSRRTNFISTCRSTECCSFEYLRQHPVDRMRYQELKLKLERENTSGIQEYLVARRVVHQRNSLWPRLIRCNYSLA